ncbi:glutamyl-tRNA reductase [Natronocella acetinitrilica]|uniref:Glutamyl-tRNA reductase n=1 Tax=Natronocella acetinitrilica TaxID=414046 RepID=A0AAE3KEC9_9GAMM|nr:glutamyl-tRNA reductase [Natronocella acetinitrilica]MCP1672952.1 glutamyl-tRNA reductase [Natronocella acetinitrilica]
MPLCAIGLNHKSAPVEVRERVVFPAERLQTSLQQLTSQSGVHEAALISTCNRTEIYTLIESPSEVDTVLGWLAGSHALEPDWLRRFVYTHLNEQAVSHLLRVTPGLDSLVLGEPQIGGQAKSAYLEAVTAGTVGPVLDRLFQHAFTVSKLVRTQTGIGSHPVSVAFAAVALAKQIFGDLDKYTALLLGAGETIELTARHLHQQGLRKFLVANRTRERATELAAAYNGEAIALADMPDRLSEADIVIASTASQLPLLGKGSVERALRRRKHRPIFMVDIAVPRDIEPEVGELEDVYLYTVDDLHDVIEENLSSRRHAASEAEEIIDLQAERFMAWMRSLNSVPTIRHFRGRAEYHRDHVLERALRRLRNGDAPEQALEYLANTLTNRLLHVPTIRLREAGERGEEELLDAARSLLEMDRVKPDDADEHDPMMDQREEQLR